MSILQREPTSAGQFAQLRKIIYSQPIPAAMQSDIDLFVSTALCYLYASQKKMVVLEASFLNGINAYSNILAKIVSSEKAESQYSKYIIDKMSEKCPKILEAFITASSTSRYQQQLQRQEKIAKRKQEEADELQRFETLIGTQLQEIASKIPVTEDEHQKSASEHDMMLLTISQAFLKDSVIETTLSKNTIAAFETICKIAKNKEFLYQASFAYLLDNLKRQCPGIFSRYQQAIEEVRIEHKSQTSSPQPPISEFPKIPFPPYRSLVAAWVNTDSPIFCLNPDKEERHAALLRPPSPNDEPVQTIPNDQSL